MRLGRRAFKHPSYVYYQQDSRDTPPYTRNWSRLADLSGIYNRLNESQREFLDILEPLNIEARYPTHKDAILKSLTREECELLVGETKELSEWIKSRL